MKALALIPARSGSKGIPGKNTRPLWGRPLLAWAVDIGRRTCDKTYVTTDDPNIGLLASQYGASVIVRPAELATDEAGMFPVVQHALHSLEGTFEPDVIVLLQPTQPLRTAEHIHRALAMLEDGVDAVASVVEVPAHYSPDMVMRFDGVRLEPFLGKSAARRQEARQAYSRDGTVYAIRTATIKAGSLYGSICRPLVIPPEESCNLDTESDWNTAERMMEAPVHA